MWCRRYDADNTGNIDDREMMQALQELGVLDPKVDCFLTGTNAFVCKKVSLHELVADSRGTIAVKMQSLVLKQNCPPKCPYVSRLLYI